MSPTVLLTCPYPGGIAPCWHCRHFERLVANGSAARCVQDGLHVRAQPENGCVHWEREPGSDDEPGPPPAGRYTGGV